MDQTASPLAQSGAPERVEHIKTNMRQIEGLQWWLWPSAVLITLLLTVGITSVSFPGLLEQGKNGKGIFLCRRSASKQVNSGSLARRRFARNSDDLMTDAAWGLFSPGQEESWLIHIP